MDRISRHRSAVSKEPKAPVTIKLSYDEKFIIQREAQRHSMSESRYVTACLEEEPARLVSVDRREVGSKGSSFYIATRLWNDCQAKAIEHGLSSGSEYLRQRVMGGIRREPPKRLHVLAQDLTALRERTRDIAKRVQVPAGRPRKGGPGSGALSSLHEAYSRILASAGERQRRGRRTRAELLLAEAGGNFHRALLLNPMACRDFVEELFLLAGPAGIVAGDTEALRDWVKHLVAYEVRNVAVGRSSDSPHVASEVKTVSEFSAFSPAYGIVKLRIPHGSDGVRKKETLRAMSNAKRNGRRP